MRLPGKALRKGGFESVPYKTEIASKQQQVLASAGSVYGDGEGAPTVDGAS